MTPKEKAIDLLCKINNRHIKEEDWKNASEYAKKDLIRKAKIIIEEVIDVLNNLQYIPSDTIQLKFSVKHWEWVREELNKL